MAQSAPATPAVALPPAAQITCSDPERSRALRSTGNDAARNGDNAGCIAAYSAANDPAACATPEARYNLAACLQNVGRYAEAVGEIQTVLREFTAGTSALPRGVEQGNIERRLGIVRELARQAAGHAPAPNPPSALRCATNQSVCRGACHDFTTDVNNCGICGHACGTNSTCSAGICHLVVTPPATTSTLRTVGLAGMIGGGTIAVIGIGVLTLGYINQSAADADAQTLRTQGCTSTRTTRCYLPGATTPDSLAAWQVPAGYVMTGVGLAAAGVGTYLFMTHPRTSTRPTASYDPTTGTSSIGVIHTF